MSTVKIKSLFENHNPMRDQSAILAARQSLNEKQNIQHGDYVDNKYNVLESATSSIESAQKNRLDNAIFERQTSKALDRILREGKEMIFKKIFGDLVVESLIMDKEEVLKREAGIRQMAEAFITAEGGYALLESTASQNKVPFLTALREACEDTSKKVTNRIGKEIRENKETTDPNSINFNLTDDEADELDYTKSEIALPEISEIVSDKVVKVIKEEKSRAKEQEEIEEAIKAEVQSEVGDEATTEAFTAAFNNRIQNKDVRESSTLFNSTLRNVTMSTIQERAQSFDIKPSTKTDEYFETRTDVLANHLYDMPEDDDELDLILAEAVLNFTILECAHTIGLKQFTRKDVKEMSEALLN